MVSGGISLSNGPECTYEFGTATNTGGSSPPPPVYSYYSLDMIASASVDNGATTVTDTDEVASVTLVTYEVDPGEGDWSVYSETIDEEWSATAELSLGPLYLYKGSGSGIQKEVNADLNNPTHPLHFWVAYAWGTRGPAEQSPADTYSKYADAGYGTAEDSSSGHTKTASRPTDANGVPTPGGGTAEPFSSISIWLTIVNPTSTSISGDVAKWTDLKYYDGTTYTTLDLTGHSSSYSWGSVVGGNGTLTMTVTDYTNLPTGTPVSSTVTIEPPVIVTYDLEAYDWADAYSGAEFTITDTDGTSLDVGRGYASTLTYEYDLATSTDRRIWVVSPTIASAWATTNNEIVDPSDARCTIEERGLTGATGDWDWAGFDVKRDASLSVQLPSDAGGSLPSAWVAQDGYISVGQSGKTTTLTISGAATSSAVKRTLQSDYFTTRLTESNLNSVGIPKAYQLTEHTAGDDIWCWSQFPFLRFTYQSSAAQTVTFRLQNTTVTDMADDHLSGSERAQNIVSDYETASAEHEWTVAFPASAIDATVVVDLWVPSDVHMFHVDWIELDGFSGGSSGETFTLKDIELLGWNPTSETAAGKTTAKIVFPRPDSSALPISYTGATFTADGTLAVRPPDQIRTKCSEAGLDFCNYIRDRTTADINDKIRDLSYWFELLDGQEGMSVDYTTTPHTVNGQTEYDAAFVDTDGNDMLGGTLHCGDVKEAFDLAVNTSASSYTNVPTCVRVGRIYLAAGITTDCRVRKHIRGNLHGLVRSNAGRRYGNGLTVSCWENQSGTYVQCASTATDNWSRYAFTDGGREAFTLVAVAGLVAPTSGGTQTYNEVRAWQSIVEYLQSCGRVALTPPAPSGLQVYVYSTDSVLYACVSPNAGASWLTAVQVSSGCCPSVAWSPDGSLVLAFVQRSGGTPTVYTSEWRGEGWDTPVELISGVDCPGHCVARHGGLMWLVGLVANGSNYDLYAWDAHYLSGAWSVISGSQTLIDSSVDYVTPSIAEGPDGHLSVTYAKSSVAQVKRSSGRSVSEWA